MIPFKYKGGVFIFCSHCGAQCQEDAAFCLNCGKSLSLAPPTIDTEQPPARPKKKRRWPFVLIGIILLFVCLIWIFSDGETSSDDPVPAFAEITPTATPTPKAPRDSAITAEHNDPGDTWAIYWYLCGSDLETEGAYATNDFAEMMDVELPDNVSVIIETGGARRWHNGVESDGNSRFLYDSGGITLLEKTPLANMGDGKTLEEFLRFCNENYPADHKIALFWNHGGGSVAGVIFDELFDDDSLSLPEIRAAFEAVTPPSAENPPYEIIGFDACLMATIDMVETCAGFARYLVASQELEPALGWNYSGFLQALSDDTGMSGAHLSKVICDTYYTACEEWDLADDVTLSVVDLSLAEELIAAYHNVGAESLIYACVNTRYFNDFARAAKKAQSYGGNNVWDGYTNMVDLGDLVHQSGDTLLPEYGRELLDALESCVVYQVKGPLRSRASGLACYYNFNGDYNNFSDFAHISGDSPFRWYFDYALTGELSADGQRFVRELANTYASAQDVAPKTIPSSTSYNLEDFPLTYKDDGYVALELGFDIADKLAGIYCYIAYYEEDEGLYIMLGRDNDLDADWETGVFMDNFRGVWGSIDGALVYMELTDEADDYQTYTVPVLLNGEEYSLSVSYTYGTEEYKIIGARRGIDENGIPDRNLLQLKPGDVIEPLHYVMHDNDNDFQLQAVESVTVNENTRFEETDLGDGQFIFVFEMVDVQNNSYLSEAAVFSVENGEIYLLEADA